MGIQQGVLFVYFHVDPFDKNRSIFIQADYILYTVACYSVLKYD